MKLGISVRIDVTKIEKARIHVGKKGKYIDLTTFIDLDQTDEYGNHGFIAHSVSKEEREAKTLGAIVGNTKVFYNDSGQSQAPQQQPQTTNQPNPRSQPQQPADDFDTDLPF